MRGQACRRLSCHHRFGPTRRHPPARMRCRVSRSTQTHLQPSINFKQAQNDSATIPPGPNGPVGSVWIALDKPTYGIHGTPDPPRSARPRAMAACA